MTYILSLTFMALSEKTRSFMSVFKFKPVHLSTDRSTLSASNERIQGIMRQFYTFCTQVNQAACGCDVRTASVWGGGRTLLEAADFRAAATTSIIPWRPDFHAVRRFSTISHSSFANERDIDRVT